MSCFQSDYTKLVKAELEKGQRQDSILLGIKFGNSKDEFYGKCFDLNKNHLVIQGPNTNSVQYSFSDSSVHKQATPIRLLFTPSYDEKNKINEMTLEFSYTAWAPWNKDLQADSLMPKVKKLLVKWYGGNEFIEAEVGEGNLPVKLDGNRRIILFKKDTQSVIVRVQDILHEKFKHSISK